MQPKFSLRPFEIQQGHYVSQAKTLSGARSTHHAPQHTSLAPARASCAVLFPLVPSHLCRYPHIFIPLTIYIPLSNKLFQNVHGQDRRNGMEDGDVGIYSVYISLPFPSPVDYHSLAGQKKMDGIDSLSPLVEALSTDLSTREMMI